MINTVLWEVIILLILFLFLIFHFKFERLHDALNKFHHNTECSLAAIVIDAISLEPVLAGV